MHETWLSADEIDWQELAHTPGRKGGSSNRPRLVEDQFLHQPFNFGTRFRRRQKLAKSADAEGFATAFLVRYRPLATYRRECHGHRYAAADDAVLALL